MSNRRDMDDPEAEAAFTVWCGLLLIALLVWAIFIVEQNNRLERQWNELKTKIEQLERTK